jgi:hypothetical protein
MVAMAAVMTNVDLQLLLSVAGVLFLLGLAILTVIRRLERRAATGEAQKALRARARA